MSNNNFVKGACRQCAGHLEFPADAAGEIIACPHCGRPTTLTGLVSPNKISHSSRLRLAIFIATLALAAGMAAAYLLINRFGPILISQPQATPAVRSNAANSFIASSVPPTGPPVAKRTNEFAISPVKLVKTPGSSLVYVTGNIRNLTSRQRFGVKIEFGLFDTNDTAVGKATDYQSVLEPNGDWRFKALVMDSKAASARFNSIVEDQP